METRLDDPALDVEADDILVLKHAGPRSDACMPEAGYLPIPRKLAARGVSVRALDLAPPIWVWNATLGTAAFRGLAHAVYFHRRGAAEELPYPETQRSTFTEADSPT